MKKYSLFFFTTAILYNLSANSALHAVPLESIAKPSWKLQIAIPLLAITKKESLKNRLSFLHALYWIWAHRTKHNGFLHDNGLVVKGMDALFIYTATKFPVMWNYLEAVQKIYTAYLNIDYNLIARCDLSCDFGQSITVEHEVAIDEIERLIERLKAEGVYTSCFNLMHLENRNNSPELIAYLTEYLRMYGHNLKVWQKKAIQKIISPELFIQQHPNWYIS